MRPVQGVNIRHCECGASGKGSLAEEQRTSTAANMRQWIACVPGRSTPLHLGARITRSSSYDKCRSSARAFQALEPCQTNVCLPMSVCLTASWRLGATQRQLGCGERCGQRLQHFVSYQRGTPSYPVGRGLIAIQRRRLRVFRNLLELQFSDLQTVSEMVAVSLNGSRSKLELWAMLLLTPRILSSF